MSMKDLKGNVVRKMEKKPMRAFERRAAWEREEVAPHVVLASAASFGKKEVVEALLNQGANVNGTGRGWSPLSLACSTGQKETAFLLMEKGADVNGSDTDKGIPLLEACLSWAKNIKGGREIALELIKRGAIKKTRILGEAETDTLYVLIKRIEEGDNLAPLKELAKEKISEACMILATEKGLVNVVKALMEKGGVLNDQMRKEIRDKMFGSSWSHTEAKELLTLIVQKKPEVVEKKEWRALIEKVGTDLIATAEARELNKKAKRSDKKKQRRL